MKHTKKMRNKSRKKVKILRNRDGDLCGECKKLLDFSILSGRWQPTVDHIIPLSNGGTNDLNNLELVHHRCNLLRERKESRKHKIVKESATRIRYCEHCGIVYRHCREKRCTVCRKAFMLLWAGVGIS